MADLVSHAHSFLWLFTLVCSAALADVPATLNYQGTLADNAGKAINGTKTITFSLYNTPTGLTPFWSEDQTVPLTDGKLSVVLGDNTAKPIDPKLFTGETYIGIKVAGDAEMPRQKLTSVAYALQSGGIPRGVIWMWSGNKSDIPLGWALCDGTQGTPNLQGRFILGADTPRPIGTLGGEAAHVLTVNEMPSHTHLQDAHLHNRGTSGTSAEAVGYGALQNSSAFQNRLQIDNIMGSNPYTLSTTATNQYTGGGTAHNNIPPFYALAFIMKL